GREVALLDGGDNRFPDPGSLTYLSNGETGLPSRIRQGVTDAHEAPPGNSRSIVPVPSAYPQSPSVTTATLRISPRLRSTTLDGCLGAAQGTPVIPPLPAPQRREHFIEVIRPDQYVPCFGTFAWADNTPALQEVHQPAGLCEPHAQLALQHRGRPELG